MFNQTIVVSGYGKKKTATNVSGFVIMENKTKKSRYLMELKAGSESRVKDSHTS